VEEIRKGEKTSKMPLNEVKKPWGEVKKLSDIKKSAKKQIMEQL
jgi:hypothetical protein